MAEEREKKKRVVVHVPEETYRLLRWIAYNEETTVSEICRRAFDEYIAKEREYRERVRAAIRRTTGMSEEEINKAATLYFEDRCKGKKEAERDDDTPSGEAEESE